MPNFIAWEYTSFLGPSFPGMRELILNLMSNVSYLAVILGFLVVTACYLLVTGCYCLLPGGPGGYCSLPLITACSHF